MARARCTLGALPLLEMMDNFFRDRNRAVLVPQDPLYAGSPPDLCECLGTPVDMAENIPGEERLQGLPPAGPVTPPDAQAREKRGDGPL
jgi:hypothetical protein